MKRYIIQLYLVLCFVVVGSLFSMINAQVSGEGVISEGGVLTLYNSIVWDNGSECGMSSGADNLIGEDPLFASGTDFFLKEGSAAKGRGNNSHWDGLMGIALKDIAGIGHANPMNIGAYESNVSYLITISTNVTVYLGNTALTTGVSLTAGTELKIVANVQPGSKLESLIANGNPIANGEPFILTGDTEFDAIFLPARANVYATMKDGVGKLNVFNTIIYDNIDLFGNYSPDVTNTVADPKFSAQTTFTLQPESQALGNGDGSKLPRGIITDIGGLTFDNTGSIDAGAYQEATYTVSWGIPSNGTLEVFKYEKDASGQWVETALTTSPASVSAGTIIVRAKSAVGYYLKELKYNGTWINSEDEAKDPLKTPLFSEGRFSLTSHTKISTVFVLLSATDKVAASIEGGTFMNNIIYDNNGLASNLTEADPKNPVNNLLDVDPKFTNETNFNLQPSSPALNKGTNEIVAAIEKDLAGGIRIQGSVVDMGALESNSVGYTVIYRPKLLSKNDVVATVELYDGNTLVESGTQLLAGTVLTVRVTILDEHFEQLGRIKLNDGVLDSYIDGTEFTLNANTTVTVQVQAKEYTLSYSGTNVAVMVYSGITPQASGSKIYYDNYLTVQIYPETHHELRYVTVNGQHIDGAEVASGYVVHVQGDVTITASATPIYELDNNGDPILKDPPVTADPTDPINWEPAVVKGLITWDALNGLVTVTKKDDGSIIQSGDLLTAETTVNVKIEPVATSGYKLVLIEVNGVSHPYTEFELIVPREDGGKIATTFIGVRYEKMTDDEIAQQPDPNNPQTNVDFRVSLSVTGGGTLSVLKSGTAIQSGDQFKGGTVLTINATPAAGYMLSSLTANGLGVLSGANFTLLEATSIIAVFEKEGVSPTPPTPTDKKIMVTVMGSGTVTLKDGITAAVIQSGEWVANNTSIVVNAVAASGYELTALQVNGNGVTNGSAFTVTENSSVVAVFDRIGETPTPPVIPPTPPAMEYVTLTIGGGLPAGITMTPGAGTHTIVKGSNQTLRLSVDSRYNNMYIYLKINNEYVMIRSNNTNSELTYTLVDVNGNMSIGVVVSATPDPDPENPNSNTEVKELNRIWAASGAVHIEAVKPDRVSIYTLQGRLVIQQSVPAGETVIQLADGFYVVVLQDKTTAKVIVRQ